MSKPMPRLTLVGAGNDHPPAGQPSPEFPGHGAAMPRMLSLDAHGRILDWMHWQDAACLYVRGAVAWTMGEPCLTVHGGTCATIRARAARIQRRTVDSGRVGVRARRTSVVYQARDCQGSAGVGHTPRRCAGSTASLGCAQVATMTTSGEEPACPMRGRTC